MFSNFRHWGIPFRGPESSDAAKRSIAANH
jgi:hypothetical protein